jgi:preprotein translocase subunit SecA
VYAEREEAIGREMLRRLEKSVVLSIIDNKWREHLQEMDYLRAGIGLRAMGQRDPLVEYQREGYDMFAEMVSSIKNDSIRYLYHVEVVEQPSRPQPRLQVAGGGGTAPRKRQARSDKTPRNAPCPCGSGKKYKRCHGAA